jgi:uncharacterized protein involved in response to NO
VLYISVTIGALVRIAASLGLGPYRLLLDIGGFAWIAALALFLAIYGPMLWQARAE